MPRVETGPDADTDRRERRALILILLLASAIVFAICVIAYRDTRRLLQANEWVDRTIRVRDALANLRTDLADAESARRAFLFSHREDRRQAFLDAFAGIEPTVRQIDTLIRDPRQQQKILQLQLLISERIDQYRSALKESESGATLQARDWEIPSTIIVRRLLTEMRSEEDNLLHARRDEVVRQRRNTIIAFSGGLLTSILLLAFAAVIVRRQIVRRQRSADEAHMARTLLSEILEGLDDGVVFANARGEVELFNPAAKRILGMDQTPATLREWPNTFGLFNADGEPLVISDDSMIARAVRGETSNEVEEVIRTPRSPSGTYISVSARPIRGLSGQLEGGVVHIRDISERKRFEAELSHRAGQLEASNRELESFSYSVSHDLRAPLRSINGFSQILAEDHSEKLGPDGAAVLGRIRSATQRMGQLIDDLLKLSRVTRAELRRQVTDLSALARRIGEELSRQEPGRAVTFEIGEGISAVADTLLLRVALENLLGNAFKFTRGRVPACIKFGTDGVRDGQRVFVVSDNGAGFDMTYAEKLFGAFQRLHTEAEFPGTGIGLATVRRIVERHGGRVWANGEVDKGANFFFSLPEEEIRLNAEGET